MRFIERLRQWLGLPFKCKLGAHRFDANEIGFGFGRIDYYCPRCQRAIRSVALDSAGPDDIANLEQLRGRISQVLGTPERGTRRPDQH